ncbi:hypothetical protein [Amycolatopsis sp. cmx-11-51]|uniref:hypothetical protein n=1 Tax=unclassified Amycolatopsis TaxID=2618356 RepID=UPI0039E37FF5
MDQLDLPGPGGSTTSAIVSPSTSLGCFCAERDGLIVIHSPASRPPASRHAVQMNADVPYQWE